MPPDPPSPWTLAVWRRIISLHGCSAARACRHRCRRESNSGAGSEPRAEGAGIVAVYLFGSCARGTAKGDSDVDLGMLYERPPAPELLAQPFLIGAQLADQLARSVQCVVMNTAPVDLVHRILRDGVLLLDLNPSHRIRFEIDARNRYFDLKPLLDRYRQVSNVA